MRFNQPVSVGFKIRLVKLKSQLNSGTVKSFQTPDIVVGSQSHRTQNSGTFNYQLLCLIFCI